MTRVEPNPSSAYAPGDAGHVLRADARANLERVLEAAVRVLASDPTASVQRIADAADVHRSTIYRRFPTRESLVSALFARALAGIRAAIARAAAEPDPQLETVGALAASIVSLESRYAFVHAHRAGHDLDDVVVELCLFLQRLQRAGVVRSDLPPTWLAATLASLAAGGLEEVELGRMGLDEAGAVVARTYAAAVAPPV